MRWVSTCGRLGVRPTCLILFLCTVCCCMVLTYIKVLRIYPRLNVPLEIWSRKLKTRSRSTFDRVTAISTLAFKEEINKEQEMGKIKWDLFAKFVLCVPNQVQRLTLGCMEPGTPLSPQEIPGPRSSCLISPLKKKQGHQSSLLCRMLILKKLILINKIWANLQSNLRISRCA